MSAEQLAGLPELLHRGAESFGFRGAVWTRKRVAAVIKQEFGVSYTPMHVGRLLKAIINPAMIATWVLGLWLAWYAEWYRSGWLQVKFLLVIVLSALHGMMVRWVRDFAHDRNRHSQRFYRIINEVPTVFMIAIVILAVVKPF